VEDLFGLGVHVLECPFDESFGVAASVGEWVEVCDGLRFAVHDGVALFFGSGV